MLVETDSYRVVRVRWPVLKGVRGEGLLFEPKRATVAHIVAIPDADQLPEQLVGLRGGLAVERQVARRLAENGVRVVVPVLIDRGILPDTRSNQTRREWIYRQAFHMGRHIIGYELAKIRWLYDQLGLPEKRDIEFFQGGRTTKGNQTFQFLHRHLEWPMPDAGLQ